MAWTDSISHKTWDLSQSPLRWRHNARDGVSNHQPHDCLLNCLFRRRSKKTPKLRVTGLCAGNSPGTGEFLAQMASNAENVSIWWRHHGFGGSRDKTCYATLIRYPGAKGCLSWWGRGWTTCHVYDALLLGLCFKMTVCKFGTVKRNFLLISSLYQFSSLYSFFVHYLNLPIICLLFSSVTFFSHCNISYTKYFSYSIDVVLSLSYWWVERVSLSGI